MDEHGTWDNALLLMLEQNAMPPQKLYFCLAVIAKRMGLLWICFLRACRCVGVVVEGLFVCHRAVDKRGWSPLTWIGQMHDDKGLFSVRCWPLCRWQRDAITHVYRRWKAAILAMVNIDYRVTSMGLTEVFHTEFLCWLGNFCVEFVIVTSKGPQEPRRISSTKNCQ